MFTPFGDIERSAREKMARYEQEAELYRAMPRGGWRVGLAAALHALAERLEPSAEPLVVLPQPQRKSL